MRERDDGGRVKGITEECVGHREEERIKARFHSNMVEELSVPLMTATGRGGKGVCAPACLRDGVLARVYLCV